MIYLLKYWKVGAIALLLIAVWTAGYRFRGNMADADIAELTAAHTETLTTLDRTKREALQTATDAARAAENKRVTDMAALDQRYTQEITNAKLETDAALAAVRSGELRLRNRFTCNPPTAGSSVPETSPGSSVGNAAPIGGLQIEDAEAIVRAADQCDAIVIQLQAAQAIIRADRQ